MPVLERCSRMENGPMSFSQARGVQEVGDESVITAQCLG